MCFEVERARGEEGDVNLSSGVDWIHTFLMLWFRREAVFYIMKDLVAEERCCSPKININSKQRKHKNNCWSPAVFPFDQAEPSRGAAHFVMTLSVPRPPPTRDLSGTQSLLTPPSQRTCQSPRFPVSRWMSLHSSSISRHPLPSRQHHCSRFNDAWARLMPSFFTVLNQVKIRCFSDTTAYSAVGLPQQFGLCWVFYVEISLYVQE